MDGTTPESGNQALGKLDISIVANPEAKAFAAAWSTQRNLNTEFYASVPNDRFDSRIAEGSPSSRDNLEYQIRVHDNYLKGVREGALVHGKHYEELDLTGKSRDELLALLDEIDRGVLEFISSDQRTSMVTVPWSDVPITAINALWGLKDHEVYHLGRNAVMGEALGIPRSDKLKKAWG